MAIRDLEPEPCEHGQITLMGSWDARAAARIMCSSCGKNRMISAEELAEYEALRTPSEQEVAESETLRELEQECEVRARDFFQSLLEE